MTWRASYGHIMACIVLAYIITALYRFGLDSHGVYSHCQGETRSSTECALYIVVMAYIVLACIVMAYTVMAYTVMAYTVLAYIVMAYTVMAYTLLYRFGLYSYGI